MDKTSTHSHSHSGGVEMEDPSHVTKLRENDVLLGRGGGTNNHAGNVKFRKLVNEHKLRYLAASKVDKPKVAREVVQLWRQMNPPGRFLARQDEDKKEKATEENTIWYDVGDKKANAKASQCLRERTPEVMPYLRQLREQQDLSTEQGVMMVRQQQQAAAAHQQGGMPPGVYGGDVYAGDVYGGGAAAATPHHPSYPPMSMGAGPPGNAYGAAPAAGLSPHHMRPHMGLVPSPHGHGQSPAHMNSPHNHSRRASAPHLAGPPPPSAYSPRQASNHLSSGGMYSPHQQQQQLSPHHQHHPSSMAAMPGAPPLHSPSGGQPAYSYSGVPPAAPPLEPPIDPMDPTVAAYYGDMSDMEYEQSMMIMQQQLEMQQMQLRRMQQQRAMQRAAMGTSSGGQQQQGQQQQQRNRGGNASSSKSGLTREIGNYPPGSGPSTGAPGYPAGNSNTRLPHQPPAKMSSPGTHTNNTTSGSGNTHGREAPDANARKPKRTLSMTRPERTHSGLSALRADMTHDLPATAENDNELTLEEYRQQLEAYISNTQKEDKNGLDDGGDASDLEDDWEKERDKHMNASFTRRTPNRGVSRSRSRGVDRSKSGASFMSIGTMKSANGMSVVSGFSNLSDLMSATDEERQQTGAAGRTRKGVDRTVSNQSNLSIMSELTDLSANLDNLSLLED